MREARVYDFIDKLILDTSKYDIKTMQTLGQIRYEVEKIEEKLLKHHDVIDNHKANEIIRVSELLEEENVSVLKYLINLCFSKGINVTDEFGNRLSPPYKDVNEKIFETEYQSIWVGGKYE